MMKIILRELFFVISLRMNLVLLIEKRQNSIFYRKYFYEFV